MEGGTMPDTISFDGLRRHLTGTAAAFRSRIDLEPAGGPGDKVFPATYEGGRSADEERVSPETPDRRIPCVLVDSVAAQANRMEEALRDAWERGRFPLPVISVDFAGHDLPKPIRVTSLDAPHRIADAILRDSEIDQVKFRKTPVGKKLDHVDAKHATALFEICPTALVFGMWDSTGPRGGLGAKFQRALVSEIVGWEAVRGKRVSSRIDPLGIQLGAGPLYESKHGGWTADPEQAIVEKKAPKKLGKDGKPSEANHGNVTPTIADGGYTIAFARQTTVISLAALRRLRFPLDGASRSDPEVDDIARTALAALGLLAVTLARAAGFDLRSRCQLHPRDAESWQVLDRPAGDSESFVLDAEGAIALWTQAVDEAKRAGLPFHDEELLLTPSAELIELVRRSQALESQGAADEGES